MWLAVSDLYEVKLFYLTQVGEVMQPRRVKGFQAFESLKSPEGLMQGARCIEFSADSTRLILAGSLTSDLVVLGLSYLHATPSIKILRVFHHAAGPLDQADPLRPVITPSALEDPSPQNSPSSSSPNDSPDVTEVDRESYIVKMAISPDGQWLATADSRRTLRVFNLDAMKHHCYIPMTGTVVNAMAFPGALGSVLVVGYASNTMQVIEVESRTVPLWGQELGMGEIREPMQGMVFAPMQLERDDDEDSDEMVLSSGSPALVAPTRPVTGLVWGANWVAKIRLPPPQPSLHPRPLTAALKRARKEAPHSPLAPSLPLEPDASTAASSHDPRSSSEMLSGLGAPREKAVGVSVDISSKYHHLLLLNYRTPNQIVLVQLPLFLQLESLLPPVWVRNGAYGT